MKKFLAVLLSVLLFIPMLVIGAYAVNTYAVPKDDKLCMFVYQIDGAAYFSSDKAINDLIETGETTIFLPMECEGKYVEFKYYIPYVDYSEVELGFGNREGSTYVPGDCCYEIKFKNGSELNYTVNFVCSEEAQYDYERQIGTSDRLEYVGYAFGGKWVSFLSQDEIDTVLKDGVIYIRDETMAKVPLFNPGKTYSMYEVGGPFSSSGFSYSILNITFDFQCSDGSEYDIYINNPEKTIEDWFGPMDKSFFKGLLETICDLIYWLFPVITS